MPQRVTLLYWGERRRTELLGLLDREHQITVITSPVELAKGGQSVDVLVVDVPALLRRSIFAEVRRHYRGRLLVLLDPGDGSQDLPLDHNRTLLTRPFSVQELLAALAGSAIAALAFVVAFGLVNQDAGCGSTCDELSGADLASPSTTITPVVAGPDRTASSTTIGGPATTDTSVGPTADAASQVDGASDGTSQVARTTVGSSGASSPTSPPAPTRPQPTAPTTTSPKTSTSTTTTTTTTTTTGP